MSAGNITLVPAVFLHIILDGEAHPATTWFELAEKQIEEEYSLYASDLVSVEMLFSSAQLPNWIC